MSTRSPKRRGPHTRFVIPVHLYGQLADMQALVGIAERKGLTIVEDACQAHGATRDGLRAGQAGAAAAFSFYPGKNLGAFGDAGALVTQDPHLAMRVQALREHGQQSKYRHEWEGYTARLDTIQALVLLHKLPLLDGWNEERRAVARYYDEHLNGVGDLRLPPVPPAASPSGICTRWEPRIRDGSPAFWLSAGSAPDATTPNLCTSRRHTHGSGIRRARSPWPNASQTGCCRYPSSRG